MALHQWLRPARLTGLALLAAAAVGATGCVSMDEHKRLEAAYREAMGQLASAENDIANLRKQIDALNAQLAAKDALIRSGLGSDALLRERDLLAARVAELQKKLDELTALAGQPTIPEKISSALERLAEAYPDLLEYDPKLGLIRFKSDLTFDLGSTEVKPRAREALGRLATILNDQLIATNEIRVVGHTDDVPIRRSPATVMNPTNWYLSTNRAHAVREVLQTGGVSEMRMQAAGWGEFRPITPNAPGRRGGERNRRVDIYILPTEVPQGLVISTPGPAAAPRRTAPRTAPTTAPAVPLPR